MGWPLEDTDQAEGPNPTQIDYRRPPRVEEGHLQCLLHDPRFRRVDVDSEKASVASTHLEK